MLATLMRVFHLSADFVERQHIVRNLQFHHEGHTFFALIGPQGDVDAACWWNLRDDSLMELLTPNDEETGDYWSGTVDPVVDIKLELFATLYDPDQTVSEIYEGGASLRVRDLWQKPPDDRYFYHPSSPNCERLAFAESKILFAALTDVVGSASVMWWNINEAFDNHDSNEIASDPLELEGGLRPTALACSPTG